MNCDAGATRETSSPSGGCTKVKSSWLEWIAPQIRTVSAFHNIDKIFCQVTTFDSLESHLPCCKISSIFFFFFPFQCRRDLRWRFPFPQGGAQCMQLNSRYRGSMACLAHEQGQHCGASSCMMRLQDSSSDLSAQPWAISCCWLSMHRTAEGTQVAS